MTPRFRPAFRFIRFVMTGLACGVLLASIGCAQADLSSAQNAYRNGNLPGAEKWIDQYVKNQGKGVNRVIAYLEQGNIRRDQGDLQGSLAAFDIADAAINEIDLAPDVSLSRETLAAFSNLNALPYRGTYADRIMLYTLRAMNYLELGDSERARVELRRAYERQRDAIALNAKKLEEAREAAKAESAGNNGYDAERAQSDPNFQAGLNESYAGLNQYRGYGDYANPFAEWLQGIYYLGDAADGSDVERGRMSLSRTAGMVPGNTFLDADRRMAESIAGGGPTPRTTWVVFATGTAPLRAPIRIDIPLFIFDGSVDYVGANFPMLVENSNYLSTLSVQPEGEQSSAAVQTQLLADMDSIVGEEFKNDLPVIITKTLIAAGTKATTAYLIRKSLEDSNSSDSLTSLVRIATTVYQYAANQADLRTWGSLPKQYQIARLPTPDSGKITISAGGYSASAPGGAVARAATPITVELLPGEFNVVVVRSINTYSPFRVSQFSLGKDAPRWIEPSAQ
ncbi:hypothetical protein [Algisphaera agarilytica]|uniref:Lipoprotein n=1 Tax=Algisphaera agarilytica TaxID=1385975 RepID=A0A7X0H7I6_9BACT|nr:hypothetical protein [Algisphaera agarilytica]MBB6430684.1 hypothetical protein [Algisphaera agarilytica]